jgi:hypothetical protein
MNYKPKEPGRVDTDENIAAAKNLSEPERPTDFQSVLDLRTTTLADGSSEDLRSEAARLMGRSRSAVKAEAARLNGRKGGRPRGQSADAATRERMKQAQRQRRQNEKAIPPEIQPE